MKGKAIEGQHSWDTAGGFLLIGVPANLEVMVESTLYN